MTNLDKDKRVAKLGNDNYYAWAYRTEMRLRKLGVWPLVEGTESRPAGSDTHKVVKAWQTRIDLALCEIVAEVEDTQLVHTRVSRDPAAVWERLRSVHMSDGLGSAIATWQRLFTIKKGPKITLQEHVSTIREIADRLTGLRDSPSETLLVAVLMLSLPDSYNSLIISLDTHPDKNNFDFVVQRCLNEEARQSANSGVRSSTENATFQADPKPRRDRKDITCFNCGKKGHYRSECKEPKKEEPATGSVATVSAANTGSDEVEFAW